MAWAYYNEIDPDGLNNGRKVNHSSTIVEPSDLIGCIFSLA